MVSWSHDNDKGIPSILINVLSTFVYFCTIPCVPETLRVDPRMALLKALGSHQVDLAHTHEDVQGVRRVIQVRDVGKARKAEGILQRAKAVCEKHFLSLRLLHAVCI